MDVLETLKQETKGKTSLEEFVDAFEKMCKIPLEGVNKEEEMVLYETGTFSFSGQRMFYFSLVRQFPNPEEEFCQLHMDIQYHPSERNQSFSESIWDEDVEDIFDYVRNSECYLSVKNDEIVKIDIFMDET